jgi:hypothetical protein
LIDWIHNKQQKINTGTKNANFAATKKSIVNDLYGLEINHECKCLKTENTEKREKSFGIIQLLQKTNVSLQSRLQ